VIKKKSLNPQTKKPLSEQVRKAMKRYYRELNSVEPKGLIATMKYTNNNQSRAAKILGLNRATLRKKLLKYKIKS